MGGDSRGDPACPPPTGKFWILDSEDEDVRTVSLPPSPEDYRRRSQEGCNAPSSSELMFHEVPASSDVTFKDDSGKVGKISVTGGSLEPQEIVKELEWIIPGPGSGQHVFTPVLSQGGDSKLGTGVFLGGRCSVEDVVNFGGIPSPSLNARSSERICNQGNADATQLEWTKCLAKAKDAALSPDNVCSALLGLICSTLGVTQGKIVEGDPELIDDSEFYHQLLKEFLESCDGASESAFYALRKKQQKRKLVDRRASKSRKIRYNVHEKLANFMAPVPITVPPMASKLFENLFGMGNQKATAA
ncbi:hypothetical protein ACQ4PT_041454 [Festuca glaucescens]